MKTEAVPAAAAAAQPSPERPLRPWVLPALVLSGIGALLLVFFLSIFPAKGFTAPIGWDASEYVWRTRLAQAQGLDQTTHVLPTVTRPKSGRPGYLVVGSTLSSLAGVDPIRLEMVMSSVLAVVIALGAGAFVSATLRRSWWDLAVVALVVGVSPPVIRLMMPEGYLDTMLAAGVFAVAALAVVEAIEDRRALIPGMLLLGAGAILHWSIFSIMAATLLLFGALLLPLSWRWWRSRTVGLLDTPTARVGEILVGGGVFGAGLLFAALGERLPTPRTDLSEFAKKLNRDLPKYHFALTLPAAAVGAASLAGEAMGSRGRDEPREPQAIRDAAGRRTWYVLALLLSWCAVVLGGYIGRRFLHLALPAHRFLSFGLAVPILVALGLVWIAKRARRMGRPLSVLVVAAGLALAAFVAHTQWFVAKPFMQPVKVQDAGLAGAYLDAEHVPTSRPFVLILGPVDWNNVALIGHTARAALPPDRLASFYLYVGTPQDYLAHRPIDTDVSRSYFQAIAPLYVRHPVAFVLASYDPQAFGSWVAQHPETVVGPRMAVLEGPVHRTALRSEAPPVGPYRWWRLGILAIGATLALTLVGMGWTLWAFRRWLRPIEMLAVAPAVGVAALVVVGSMVDRVGLRLDGAVGAAVPIAAGLIGWAGSGLGSRRGKTLVLPVP